ncbi:hypothetical protein GGH95_001149 [Coemansia sp. RSA 1836]|nr:hypothetical protein GGH95_001149 [Coemansia sp. RSA 1836]
MSDCQSDGYMDEDYDDYEYSEDESVVSISSSGSSRPGNVHTRAAAAAAAAATSTAPSQSQISAPAESQTQYSADLGYDDEDDDFFGDDNDFERAMGAGPTKKAWAVDFKVYDPDGLRVTQKDTIDRMVPLLAVSRDTTTLLLRCYLWREEPLVEDFIADPERTLAKSGLIAHPKAPCIESGNDEFTCEICYASGADESYLGLTCGHRFCTDCYATYATGKIREGESWRIRCPAPKCKTLLGEESARLLLIEHKDVLGRYEDNLTRSFVNDLDSFTWCPAPNCQYAVECLVPRSAMDTIIPTVNCKCGKAFCFGCKLDDHMPAPCFLVDKWMKKCKDDSETANWLKANTKECTKCKSTIEKNGGCNHMTCRECHYHFCWVCMGPWDEHGQQYYACNRFNEDSSKNARDSVSKSRAMLERYLHYYTRYNNHEQSVKLARQLLATTEKNMEHMQREMTLSWIEVQFLSDAVDVLSVCRTTLKWSYVLAYYMSSDNQKIIFENNQSDLEMATEQLNELVENPIGQWSNEEIKRKIIDKSTYVKSRWETLLSDTSLGLQENRWQFED